MRIIINRFREGLVFQARRLLCHSTLGSRVMNKKKRYLCIPPGRALVLGLSISA